MIRPGLRGDEPRLVLLAGAPRSGKSSAARRLAEATRICVVAVRGVATVASHPKIHAMTEIDYREYYIQNIAETTPDAAGSRMNRDFYRGASDEEALITKFVERSARYNGRSSTPQG